MLQHVSFEGAFVELFDLLQDTLETPNQRSKSSFKAVGATNHVLVDEEHYKRL